MSDKPLISICMATYNQEKYVADAVKSAIDQDYPNLEIVISDDCSKDGTVEEIQRALAGCRRNVIVLANAENLGIARNYERAYRASHGELVVTAGGDDISLPNRISRIAEEWVKDGKKATVVFHGGMEMSTDGTPLDKYLPPGIPFWANGWGMAYSRVVIDSFEPVLYKRAYEDTVFSMRATYLGDALRFSDALVMRRIGGTSTVSRKKSRRETESKGAINALEGMAQTLLDIEECKVDIDESRKARWRPTIERAINRNRHLLELTTGDSFIKRFKSLWGLGLSKFTLLRLPYLLPAKLCDKVYAMRDTFKR